MTEQERNDYFYVCALIEYIARETKNHFIYTLYVKKWTFKPEKLFLFAYKKSGPLTSRLGNLIFITYGYAPHLLLVFFFHDYLSGEQLHH